MNRLPQPRKNFDATYGKYQALCRDGVTSQNFRTESMNLSCSPSSTDRVLACDFLIEAAMMEPTESRALQDFTNATEMLEASVSKEHATNWGLETEATIKARTSLAYIPIYQYEKTQGALPTPELQSMAYESLVTIFEDLDATWEEINRDRGNQNNRSGIVGVTSELAALTLLQRYALMNHPDQSWNPIPALPSEDRFQQIDDSSLNGNWDISVRTRVSSLSEIENGYQIQVKNRYTIDEKIYLPTISVVHLREDILENEDGHRRQSLTSFGKCAVEEYDHNLRTQQQANVQMHAMQTQLLDIIG